MSNRIIKFRIWDVEKQYFWFPCFNGDTVFKEIFNDEGSIVQEFTGLKDKNEKEIYEGDIVHILNAPPTSKHIVVFDEGKFGLSELKNKDYSYIWTDLNRFIIEIVGNIFETPKLLK